MNHNVIMIRCPTHQGAAPPAAPLLSKLPYRCCIHNRLLFPVHACHPFAWHLELSSSTKTLHQFVHLKSLLPIAMYRTSTCTAPQFAFCRRRLSPCKNFLRRQPTDLRPTASARQIMLQRLLFQRNNERVRNVVFMIATVDTIG